MLALRWMFVLDIFTRFSIKRVFSIFCMSRAPIVRRFVWLDCVMRACERQWKWYWIQVSRCFAFACKHETTMIRRRQQRMANTNFELSCCSYHQHEMKLPSQRASKTKISTKICESMAQILLTLSIFFSFTSFVCYQKNVTWNLLKFIFFRFCWHLSSDRTCYGKLASSFFSVVIKHFNQIATVKCYSISHWTH